MEIYKYSADTHMGTGVQCHQFTVHSLKYASAIHYHDFYELFLITKGSTIHVVNDEKQYLAEGTLVFVRPQDKHYYEYDGINDCEFINICYTSAVLEEAFLFLGDTFIPERILGQTLSPHTLLSMLEKNNLAERLEKLQALSLNERPVMELQLKGILIELLLEHFWRNEKKDLREIPFWMESLLVQMQKKENFTVGISKMRELSGKSQGHLNRVFKNVLDTTPVEYVNNLRLQYARHLLLTTMLPVMEICFEAGFNNLSHFYHLFKESYGTPPGRRDKQ